MKGGNLLQCSITEVVIYLILDRLTLHLEFRNLSGPTFIKDFFRMFSFLWRLTYKSGEGMNDDYVLNVIHA